MDKALEEDKGSRKELKQEVEMPALDWGGHSKKSHNTSLESKRFIRNHELSEHCSFVR